MKRPKGVENTVVWVSEVEWSGLGKCDQVWARLAESTDAFWSLVNNFYGNQNGVVIIYMYR